MVKEYMQKIMALGVFPLKENTTKKLLNK